MTFLSLLVICNQLLNQIFCCCSVNSSTNQIDLSLRGPDVKDKDPAPHPKKRQRIDSEQSERKTKRGRKDSNDLQVELKPNDNGNGICIVKKYFNHFMLIYLYVVF